MCMSRKGNDLVRGYLWNAAKTATLHNPVVRALYARQRALNKRGDVALGHCMRKLLHLVFAVWKTDRPFTLSQPEGAETSTAPSPEMEKAEGRKGQSPDRQAVTPAPSKIPPPGAADNVLPAPQVTARPSNRRLDFAQLRRQVSMEQVLRELHWWDCLKGHGVQRRGPCPIHEESSTPSRSFSVNLGKNVFQCFDASCGARGNVLDLWAQSRRLPLSQAAHELAERLGISAE